MARNRRGSGLINPFDLHFPRSALAAQIARLRTLFHKIFEITWARLWFPHVPLALLLGLGGVWLLEAEFHQSWQTFFGQLFAGALVLPPNLLPPLLIGGGVITMALGLLFRSRVAWNMALLLAATAGVSTLFEPSTSESLLVYFILVFGVLLISWRHFDRASIAASTLFALTSVAMLVMYATFGSYYLGAQFKPQITDLVTALYYSMVTMSTVGYGDISPQTADAKLFAISIIVLGVAVFATSLTAIITPLISNSLFRAVNRRGASMKRKNHFVIIGNTSLAVNTWHELASRGRDVTRVLREAPKDGEMTDVDVVVGDPSSVEILRQAGAQNATAVMAMMDDDSENAFTILAVKELEGAARTIAAVNDARHLSRIKLAQPDVVIAPQVLGGELLAMLLSGEEVTSEFVMQRVFMENATAAAEGAKKDSV